jgi:HEAT repeat protein
LIDGLQIPRSDVDKIAAEALGQIGDPRAVEPLIELMQHSKNHYSIVAAINALSNFKDDRIIEPLTSALGHHKALVFTSAVEAIREVGDRKALKNMAAELATVKRRADEDTRERWKRFPINRKCFHCEAKIPQGQAGSLYVKQEWICPACTNEIFG